MMISCEQKEKPFITMLNSISVIFGMYVSVF